MQSLANLIYLIFHISHLDTTDGQTCSNGLTSPPTLSWTPSALSSEIYTAILTFDVSTKTWNNDNISLTTRLFNDLLGGPTMRMERGKKYEITLINNLEPERVENEALTGPQERDPNTTNLHTHGIHISGLAPGDDVFTSILPESNRTYMYNIPCTHSGGIHWYHSHHHTSVQLHVGGGAAGAIIMEDNALKEGLPDWYINMRELIFFINHIDSIFINDGYPSRTQQQEDNQLVLKLIPNNQDLYIVNGKYKPTICQTVGEWIKFRFAQTEIRDPQRYQVGNIGCCTLKLLARDGIIVNNPPRDVGNIVWLSESSRADIAITCIEGIHSITVLRDSGNIDIAFIHAEKHNSSDISEYPLELTPFQPIRPPYLRDLSNVMVDNALTMEMRHDSIVIDNTTHHVFNPDTDIYFDGVSNIAINTVNEWTLIPQQNLGFDLWHPVHLHVNHFQIISGSNGKSPVQFQTHLVPPYGYQEPGDFIDTLWGPGVIRFITDIWGGPLIVHCHTLEHEVLGAMGTIMIENGCDNCFNDYNIPGSCTFGIDSCDPTIQSSGSPSLEPTYNPTHNPTLEPTFNPTVSPSGPTIEPTYQPASYPTPEPTYKPTISPTIIPTSNPTILPTTHTTTHPTYNPTVIPTNNPSKQPTLIPTIAPSSNPTVIPTIYPSFNPSNYHTLTPTSYPTETEMQHRVLICGDQISGLYNNEILYFKIKLPFTEDLIFDASNSNFNIKKLKAFQKNGFEISTDGNILTLHNLAIGEYTFSIEANKNTHDIFTIIITCQSLNDTDTPSPTIFIVNNTILSSIVTDILDDNLKNNNNQLLTSHIVGIYSIIGVLLLTLIVFLTCSGVMRWRKIHNIENITGIKTKTAIPKRWSIKSVDTQFSNDTNNSSPTTGIISSMDDSPFDKINSIQIEAPPPIKEWSVPYKGNIKIETILNEELSLQKAVE